MAAKELVEILLQVSEKSAKIARAWRCQEELFELMVEEKAEKEKNERFVRDFKTLADVLVQEVVKHDVSLKVSWIDCLHYFVQSFLKQESIHHRCNFFFLSYSFLNWEAIFWARNPTYSKTALAKKLELRFEKTRNLLQDIWLQFCAEMRLLLDCWQSSFILISFWKRKK